MTRSYLGYVSSQTTDTIVATTGYGVATGGSSSSITVSGQNYTMLTFTATGTLTVSKSGLFDVLMVGGGGGGSASGGSFDKGQGGGGSSFNGDVGAGGSGIVYVRFKV